MTHVTHAAKRARERVGEHIPFRDLLQQIREGRGSTRLSRGGRSGVERHAVRWYGRRVFVVYDTRRHYILTVEETQPAVATNLGAALRIARRGTRS